MKKKRPYRDGKQRRHRVPRTRRRPNVTEPPPGPRKRTWIRGTLTFDGDYVPHVGGESLARAFAEFDGKRVRVTIEVQP
jgi:hypothetical protein